MPHQGREGFRLVPLALCVSLLPSIIPSPQRHINATLKSPANQRAQLCGTPHSPLVWFYPTEAPHALSVAAKKRSSPPALKFLASPASLPSKSAPPGMPSHGTPHAGGPEDAVCLLRVPGYLEAFSWARRSTAFWRKWKESLRSSSRRRLRCGGHMDKGTSCYVALTLRERARG